MDPTGTPLVQEPLSLEPHAQRDLGSLVAEGATLDLVADGGAWFEGPAWTGTDEVTWSDVVGNRLYSYSPAAGQRVVLEPSHHQNGHAIDREGRLVAASHGERAVVRREHDGSWTVLAERSDGRRFHSPNDLVVTTDGSIWFTDPRYGLDKPEEGYGGEAELDGNRVYRWHDAEVHAVTESMPAPNGLAFSTDERVLYVADSHVGHLLAFDVDGAGHLGEPHVVVQPDDDGHPDGLRLDTDGRIWTSWGSAVRVYDSDGVRPAELVGALRLPHTVANLSFGGPGRSTLAITATSALYLVRTAVRGAVP